MGTPQFWYVTLLGMTPPEFNGTWTLTQTNNPCVWQFVDPVRGFTMTLTAGTPWTFTVLQEPSGNSITYTEDDSQHGWLCWEQNTMTAFLADQHGITTTATQTMLDPGPLISGCGVGGGGSGGSNICNCPVTAAEYLVTVAPCGPSFRGGNNCCCDPCQLGGHVGPGFSGLHVIKWDPVFSSWYDVGCHCLSGGGLCWQLACYAPFWSPIQFPPGWYLQPNAQFTALYQCLPENFNCLGLSTFTNVSVTVEECMNWPATITAQPI